MRTHQVAVRTILFYESRCLAMPSSPPRVTRFGRCYSPRWVSNEVTHPPGVSNGLSPTVGGGGRVCPYWDLGGTLVGPFEKGILVYPVVCDH